MVKRYSNSSSEADAAKTSGLRFLRLFETARHGILILDSAFGKITNANPFMMELLACSLDDLVGKELWEVGLAKDKAASQEAFRKVLREGCVSYDDLTIETGCGERRELEVAGNLYCEHLLTVIQCHIRDVTERKRMEGALASSAARNEHIADVLQRSMLQTPPRCNLAGIEVETHYEAALHEAEVGGDFFDVFTLKSDQVALVVGDVSGKGLTAAARTIEIKYALRAFLHEYHVAETALNHLNDFVFETQAIEEEDDGRFIVVAIAVVNTKSGDAAFSIAGGQPCLIFRAGGATESVETIGMPLGVQSSSTYTTMTTEIEPGDTIVIATDGITEARNGNAFLGIEGMASLAEQAGPSTPLPELSRAILGGARTFASGQLRDDVCLLLARRQ